MPAKPHGKVESLALALATGSVTVRSWAAANGIGEGTAYKWSGSPEFKARVRALQREIVTRAVARLTGTSTKAVTTLKRLLVSESDKVACSAATNLLRLLMDMQSHTELSERIEQLEARLNEQANQFGPPVASSESDG